ncbi:hypothetical protein BO71DRAFT_354849, partial [Aspergillus ellipticus CBS 707.79]
MTQCFYKFLTVCVVLSIRVQSVCVGYLVIMHQGQSPGERGLRLLPFWMDCGTLRMTPAQPLSVWGVGCLCPAELPGFFFSPFCGHWPRSSAATVPEAMRPVCYTHARTRPKPLGSLDAVGSGGPLRPGFTFPASRCMVHAFIRVC